MFHASTGLICDFHSHPLHLENRLLSTTVCVLGHLLGRTGMCSSPNSASCQKKRQVAVIKSVTTVFFIKSFVQGDLSGKTLTYLSKG